MTTPNWRTMAKEVFDDPSTSFWLKGCLVAALERDPVDAFNDVEVLSKIVSAWHKAVEDESIAWLKENGHGHPGH